MWASVATFTLTDTWQRIPVASGALFRVRFGSTTWGRGLIAQVPDSGPIDLYGVRKLYGRENSIFKLERPACFPTRAIALLQYAGTPWTVDLEVWSGTPTEPTLEVLMADLARVEAKIDLL